MSKRLLRRVFCSWTRDGASQTWESPKFWSVGGACWVCLYRGNRALYMALLALPKFEVMSHTCLGPPFLPLLQEFLIWCFSGTTWTKILAFVCILAVLHTLLSRAFEETLSKMTLHDSRVSASQFAGRGCLFCSQLPEDLRCRGFFLKMWVEGGI